MPTKLEIFNKLQLKKDLPDVRPGDTIRVHQRITEGDKERIQVFEGLVLVRKHGKGITATITVRKMVGDVGVEKIFPVHSPIIEKIEIIKRGKVRRAKLYYLRKARGRKARLKAKEFTEATVEKREKPVEEKGKAEGEEKPKKEEDKQ